MFSIRLIPLIAIGLLACAPLKAAAQLDEQVNLSLATSLAPKVRPPLDLSQLPDRLVLRDKILLDFGRVIELRYRLRRINCGEGICYEVDIDYLGSFSWDYRGTVIVHLILERERTGLEMYDLDGTLRDAFYITRDEICLVDFEGQTSCYPMSDEPSLWQRLMTRPFDMYGTAGS